MTMPAALLTVAEIIQQIIAHAPEEIQIIDEALHAFQSAKIRTEAAQVQAARDAGEAAVDVYEMVVDKGKT